MKHFYAFLVLLLIGNLGFGQVIDDDFEDGDLSGWGQGSAFHWINSSTNPITGSRSLKHNLSGTSGSSYIAYNTSALDIANQDTSWQFNLANGNWDPSGGNKFWIYLAANEFNINSNSVDGYAVGVNLTGTSDILTLWKVTNGSADGAIVTSTFNWDANDTVGIKVIRTAAGNWELLIDTDGGFDNLVSQGTGINNDYTFNNFFGLSFEFSSTRAGLLWMDDVLVESIVVSGPANPDALAANASSSTQIDLTYDDNDPGNNATGDNVVIVFNTDNNFDTPTGTPTVGNFFGDDEILVVGLGADPDPVFNHTGLTEGTTYYYRAYSYDNTEYSIGLSADAMTPCTTVNSFPFTEGFEGGALPSCWSQEYETGATDWIYTDGDSNVLSANTGSFNAQFYNTGGDQTKLISPALNLSGVSNPTLSFWHAQVDWSGDQDELRVYYKTSAGGTWTIIPGQEFTSSIGSWTQESVLLPNPSSDYYIAFDAIGNYGRGVVVDDVVVAAGVAPNDSDTEVYDPTFQLGTTTITAASSTTSGTAFDAFGFEVVDLGTADGLPTNITTMRFVPGPNNTAGWSDHIQGITVYDENLVDYTPTTTITDTEIILDFGTPISITDGTSLEFVLGFYLNTTNIVDSSVIQFQIDSASNGFAANISGSGFADPFLLGDIVSNDIIVDVYVTELVFSQQPSNTFVNAIMTPDVTVSAVDINGNIDTSYDLDIEITSTGTLTGNPVTATPVDGVATFTGLTHTAIGTALVITADDDLYPTINSNTFDIEEPPATYNGVGVFEKITSLAQLTDGYYVIVEAGDEWAMNNTHNGTYLSRASVTPVDDLITNPDVSIVWSIQTDGSGKTIYNDVTAKFVSYTGSSNNVQVVDNVSSNNQRWNFSYSSGNFIASNAAVTARDLQYNSGAPRFACYTGSQEDLLLYKFVESEDAILSAVPGELINLNYIETQGPSLDQELAVSGANLDNSDVILTLGGNNFELSLDQTTYSNTITLTNFDGTETSIFVRLKENLISNDYNDTLTISGGDADDITVTLQGTVLELFNLPYFNGLRNQVDWDEALAFDFEFNGTSFETSSEGYIKMPINSDIITAPINFSLYNFLEVEFDLTTFGGSSGQELTVFVSNNGIDYTGLDAFSVPGSYDTFTQIIDVTAFSATNGRIKFEITGGSNETRFRDLNIKFFEKYMFDGTDWSPSDPNGVATASDNIIITSGDAIISSNTSINTVTINPGASLTIDAVATLTVADNFTLESVSNSYSSLILDGTITGTVNYSRHINTTASTTGNDLISAPLTGQTFTSFVDANSNIVSNNDNSLYLFGPFEKPTNEYITYSSSETATLDPAIGYRAASTDDGNFIFTGTVNKTDKAIPIVSSGTGNTEWNLIGNPYPSYITLSEFLSQNGSVFTIERSGVYGYGGDASTGWTIWNQAFSDFNPDALIAPGQGFLVTSKSASETVNFTTGMRSSGDTDDFIEDERSSTVINISQLKLQITNSTKMFNTDFYFNDTATLGLNPGYDSGLLGSVDDFALYSHLVEENTGLALGIQTLNNTNLSTEVIIPLGVNANQGEQLTFSIAESTLASSVNVYLEDNLANTSTLLTTGDYILTPNTNLSGTGRFFLRFTEEALSTVENSFNNLNIYTSKATKEIVVNGQLAENTMCNIYDVQGRLVSTTQLNYTTLENRINISTVSTGIYIVKLQSNNLEKTQKLIIE
ncbi:T9SS type A sorting domain-containing protein [Psychroserpens luteus]|uniref:T9SS type A sorting domain-containing protein n=1 Tax=Psychroserpens luteus TaxID=1434066 RepID=A0ABW5ZWR2_9FLAO|nr:T9SS type A sorting domain-containing protein [Psychroserpens luteus]